MSTLVSNELFNSCMIDVQYLQCVFYSTLVNSSPDFFRLLEYIFDTILFSYNMSTLASTELLNSCKDIQFTIFSMQLSC